MICLEDAVLHPDLPLLTWAMLASSKGFALTPALAHACLGIVSDLASIPLKDHLRQVFSMPPFLFTQVFLEHPCPSIHLQ